MSHIEWNVRGRVGMLSSHHMWYKNLFTLSMHVLVHVVYLMYCIFCIIFTYVWMERLYTCMKNITFSYIYAHSNEDKICHLSRVKYFTIYNARVCE